MYTQINKNQVCLLPGLFQERMMRNREYLMELNSNALLQNFYLEAGIVLPGLQVMERPEESYLHWGWEAPTCQLRGHFLGHWMAAAAALVAETKDTELKAKLDKIVEELARCQELNGGSWAGSIPEKYFDRLERDQYVWSPQYVMHKTLLGLASVYAYTENEQALKIAENQAKWYLSWIQKVQKTNPGAVYSGEEAGMLEMWAWLYQMTGKELYLTLAEAYQDPELFRNLQKGQDALSYNHVNASIPWAHGAAKMYEITGQERWREIVAAFWKSAVTDRGTYCTGGHGAGEFWTLPHRIGEYLGERNQEFCTVYNMVRLAHYLYQWTGDVKYADYIERNLYNGFLAQQNKETGMPTYFLPLKAGSRKKWGSRTHDFWCCHGTMVQAQTLYSSLIYLTDQKKKEILVSQYIPSKMQCTLEGNPIELKQNVNMKTYSMEAFFDEHDGGQMSRWSLKFQVHAEQKSTFTIKLRIPSWIQGEPKIRISAKESGMECVTGKEAGNDCTMRPEPEIVDGYLCISREWQEDEIEVYFPCGLHLMPLQDQTEQVAVMEGPIVLAGLCTSDRGLYLAKGEREALEQEFVPELEHTYEVFPWQQSTYHTLHQPENLTFMPLYEVTDQCYTVYFTRRSTKRAN